MSDGPEHAREITSPGRPRTVDLHRAYAELAGAPRGGPIDVGGALADMVAYNGGSRLTCLALARPVRSATACRETGR